MRLVNNRVWFSLSGILEVYGELNHSTEKILHIFWKVGQMHKCFAKSELKLNKIEISEKKRSNLSKVY